MLKLMPDSLVGVSETLLIPLHYRVEYSRDGETVFKDVTAERFHDAIDYDWSKFQGHRLQRPAIAARTEIFDRLVKAFIDRHPDGLILNLGCGLDTRFYRLDNGMLAWIEIDLADVIAFREKLGEALSRRHRMLAASVLSENWIDEIGDYSGKPVLLVAEGLFPYFSEEEHKRIFEYLARRFPGQQMLFQTSAPSIVHQLSKSSDLYKLNDLSKLRTSAELKWGLEDSTQVSALDARVHFVDEFSLLAGHEHLLPLELKQRLSTEQLSKAGRIVRVRFD
jgi:O-methyltransferase involved in polyketide biosynthesis